MATVLNDIMMRFTGDAACVGYGAWLRLASRSRRAALSSVSSVSPLAHSPSPHATRIHVHVSFFKF